MTAIEITVNGEAHRADVEPRRTLADFVRDDLGLTGTHLGCEHGVCGSCTVLIDGAPARSCLTLTVQVHGASITTIEGIGTPDAMHPVQQAFYEAVSFQCGFCTPGFVTTVTAFLEERGATAGPPDDDEIRHALGGNLCRCTGYTSIVEGVRRAAELTSNGGTPGATTAGSP